MTGILDSCEGVDPFSETNAAKNTFPRETTKRNSRLVPLIDIFSLKGFLICTYNNPGITLAIDELDSNIYEHLLGELLRIMQDSGQGQLIFTSHNLRPLEVLGNIFIHQNIAGFAATTCHYLHLFCAIFVTRRNQPYALRGQSQYGLFPDTIPHQTIT